MEWVFDNAFFQLPLLEGMTYAFLALLFGAMILGLWDRFRGARSEPAVPARSYEEFQQAA
jgi:hypothetical protein